MPAYPVAFDASRFPAVGPATPPAQNVKPLKGVSTTNLGGSLRLGGPAQVNALWLQDPAGFRQSVPLNNHLADRFGSPLDALLLRQNADPACTHFHFLPGIDLAEIRWEVLQIAQVSEARFQLWSATDDAVPVWEMTKADREAQKLLHGTDGSGPLPWGQVTPGGAKFPDGLLNAANAPYQLRLTVTCGETGAVTTSWTHFDVLVHSLQLHWGPAAWIPAVPVTNTAPLLQSRTTSDETDLLMRLKGQQTAMDPEVTAVANAGNTIPLRLVSTMAAYGHFNEWFCFGKDFAYLRHKARWGDGPRIPMMVKIYPRRMDNSKLDPDAGGATWDQAGAAMGPLRLLWDWRDRSAVDRTNDENRLLLDAGNFVMQALSYMPNIADEPPNCLNCHMNRGGKRGSIDRIFPVQNGAGTLPFVVTAGATRRWASVSVAATQGAQACRSGVLFNPSRMAKDTYQVTVVLANQLKQDRSAPMVDATGTTDLLLAAHPNLPSAQSEMMEVRRQVNARYIRKRAYTPINLALISASYEVAGIDIAWLNGPPFTGLWTKVEWDQYLQDAIGMAGQLYSNAYALGHRYTEPAGQFDLKTKRYTPIVTFLARNMDGARMIDQYQQWEGLPTGAVVPPNTISETCFTLPARAAVVSRLRDRATLAYINKPRRINNVGRRWQRIVAQNPFMAAPDRRDLFYQGLKQSKKNKIDTAARQLYTQEGWQGWTEMDPTKWGHLNHPYTGGLIDLLAEMHQLKIAADAYEGVTFFHYTNILATLDAQGNPTAPQAGTGLPTGRCYELGGVAKCDTSTSLGLKSLFFVWDHPNDGRRGLSQNPVITMMDGNVTAVHEFGHNLHLTHPFGTDVWNRDMHDKNPAARPDQAGAGGISDQCVMNYHYQDTELCGICRLRLRGWSFFAQGAVRGFENTNPTNDGKPVRNSGAAYYNAFFADLV